MELKPPENQNQHILVALDALLDTRLSTLALVSPEAAVALVKDPRYFERHSDNFSELVEVSDEAYRQAYAVRDLDTLKTSQMTSAIGIVKTLLDNALAEATVSPYVDSIKVSVNMWPYQLDVETQEALCEAVRHHTAFGGPITPVVVPPTALTPKACRDRYSALVLYDLNEWLGVQVDAFQDGRMPQVLVIAPELFIQGTSLNEATFEEDEDLKAYKNVNPFRLAELFYMEHMSLELLPTEMFSIIRP